MARSRYLIALGVFLVERSDVERVRRVHLAAGRDQRRRVLLHVHLLPVDPVEERVLLHLVRSGKKTTKAQSHYSPIPSNYSLGTPNFRHKIRFSYVLSHEFSALEQLYNLSIFTASFRVS